MKKMINTLLILGVFLLVSCEDKMDNSNSIASNEVTTSNVNDGPFYYNLIEKKVNEVSYHIAYENVDAGGGFSMPSFSLNNSVMLSVSVGSNFDSVLDAPDQNNFEPENGRIQYGGDNAVLMYNMATHKVAVSSDVYIIYDTISNKIFKIVFDDYSGGVVVFRFAELTAS